MNPQYEAHERMCKSIGDMAKQNKRLEERIKRLEEAGDALCENSNPSRWDSPTDAARKLIDQSNWNKAKESNP